MINIDWIVILFGYVTDLLFGITLVLYGHEFPIIAPALFVFLLRIVWSMFFKKIGAVKEGE